MAKKITYIAASYKEDEKTIEIVYDSDTLNVEEVVYSDLSSLSSRVYVKLEPDSVGVDSILDKLADDAKLAPVTIFVTNEKFKMVKDDEGDLIPNFYICLGGNEGK